LRRDAVELAYADGIHSGVGQAAAHGVAETGYGDFGLCWIPIAR